MKVLLASNLFPKITVYDSNTQPGVLSNIVKLGVTVEADNGTVLYKTNQPTLSPIVQWGVFGLVSVGMIWLIWRAV